MPIFDFSGPDGKIHSIEGPEGSTPEQAFAALQQHLQPSAPSGPQGFMANAADFVKSIPEGVARGLGQFKGPQIEGEFFNQPFTGGPMPAEAPIPTGLPLPQGKAGEYGMALGQAFGNPASFTGPGGMALKAAGAALSGLGGKAGEDTGIPGAGLVGSLAGGAAAAKALGLKAIEAAVPKAAELKAAAKTGGEFGGYKGALNSDLELDPSKVAQLGASIEQRLNAKGFTGGPNGTAKGTLGDIRDLQSPPAGSTITAANLDTIRATLGRRSQETATDARGVTRSTPDAVAAQQALKDFNKYTQNIPQSHVVAGDAGTYSKAISEANENYAASMRTKSAENRIDFAKVNYEGKPNVTLGSQIKNQFRPLLKDESRTSGFVPQEVSKLHNINEAGGKVVDLLGSRSIPAMIIHGMLGMGSMGASLPVSVAANYAARKLGSALTAKQAKELTEMLAKRSPLYQQRLNAMPPQPSLSGNAAQLVRGGILGLQ
jgi:hypothetical protein